MIGFTLEIEKKELKIKSNKKGQLFCAPLNGDIYNL